MEVQNRGDVIKDTLYIQTDNAGDNKSKYMFAFLMMLVKEGVTKTVVLSMLLVGHTHIDIDQIFSIPSIHMTKIGRTKPILQTPQKMLDEWIESFRSHPDGVPSIEFIHAVRDLKKYFHDGVLDKIFAGVLATKAARVHHCMLMNACA